MTVLIAVFVLGFSLGGVIVWMMQDLQLLQELLGPIPIPNHLQVHQLQPHEQGQNNVAPAG